MRQALYDVANFWLDKGVGGFRMDAIPYIKKPADFSDGTPDDKDGMVSIHDMTANTDGILDFLHEFKEKVSDGKDIFTVGEANGVAADQLSEWVGENGVFDMIFEFSHVNLEFSGAEVWCKARDWSLTNLKKALTNGAYKELFQDSEEIYAFTREDQSDKLLIVVNFTGRTVTYDKAEAGLSGNTSSEILMSSYEDTDSEAGTLRPFEAQIIRVK